MRGGLHREKTESPRDLDVEVDFPEDTDFRPNLEFDVEIVESNDNLNKKAFVVPRYLLFRSVTNFDRLGAEILEPEISDPAGVPLPVGTKLTIRLIHLD